MDDEVGPSVRRRLLGRQLRDLRKNAGLSMEEAAQASGLSRASISRLESAKQTILPRTVRLLCQTYGVGAPDLDHLLRVAAESDDRGWLLEYSDTTPDWFGRYVAEEAEAARINDFELVFIPGLLQTAAYCLAVTTASNPDTDGEDFSRLVEFRLQRQAHLSDKRVAYHAIVAESALLHAVGGPDVMRHQLDHLRQVSKRPNVTVQVLPFEAGAHPAMTSSFLMLHFPPAAGAQPTIYVEVEGGAVYPDRPADVARYGWIWSELVRLALTPEESIERISRHLP